MKLRLFEFEDLPWFPATLRESMTDNLRLILDTLNFYEPVTDLLIEGLDQTHTNQMFDLCSGGGGPVLKIRKNLKAQGREVGIMLSDKFPNIKTYQYLEE